MGLGTKAKKILVFVICAFFALLFILWLVLNTVLDVARTKLNYVTLDWETADELVPPALTLCTTDDRDYSFKCGSYDQLEDNCPGSVKQIDMSADETYSTWFTKCYVFRTTDAAIKREPSAPPRNWTSFRAPMFIRFQQNSTMKRPCLYLMAYNPLSIPREVSIDELSPSATPQILDPQRLKLINAYTERSYEFSWNRHIMRNGTERWDLDIRPEVTVTQSGGSNSSTVGVVYLRPTTFDVRTTREHPILPGYAVFTIFLVLTVALTALWHAVAGPGKYQMTGLAHSAVRYYPQEHMKRPEDCEDDKPCADDVLKLYLGGLDRAKFEK